MAQITLHLSDHLKKMITDFAEQECKSVSRMCGELIERGMTHSHINLVKQVTVKNMEYLIRILNINGAIYTKLRNDKTKFDESKSSEEILRLIQKEAADYIKSQF